MSLILVVEDEERIARLIERSLRSAGHAVEIAGDGEGALRAVAESRPDLVILDLGLPDLDGLEVLRRMRGRGDRTPVVLLTARAEVADKVLGFDGGADDYLTKPFALEELLVRVRARLRDATEERPTQLTCGDLRLDLRSRRASAPDIGEVELSPREFGLLEDLMEHPGAVRSREQLLDRVWGYDFDPGTNVVEVYVSYLRRKVGPRRIDTVRGAGYRLVAPAASPPDASTAM